MKVCIVSDSLPQYHKSWSGAEIIAVKLSNMLKNEGVDTFFLTSSFDYTLKKNSERVYPIKRLLEKLGTLARNFPIDIIATNHIRRILKKEKPDIVHINAKNLFLPTIIASSKLNIPIIFTVADYFIFCPTVFLRKPDGEICMSYHGENCYECLHFLTDGFLKKIAKVIPCFFVRKLLVLRKNHFNYIHKKISSYVVLTKACQERLVKYGIPEKKTKVIYHYSLSCPKETKESIETPGAVFVGRLSEDNGIHILVKAFIQVVKEIPAAKLYLIGSGKEDLIKNLKSDISESNIENSVIFLGAKDNEEALSIISKCDLAIVPHQWPKEFGPVILVEALALGKPVITSNIGGTNEFVENGENGFLVDDFRSPEAFAKEITFLFRSPKKMEQMGVGAGEFMRNKLGKAAAIEMVTHYRSILKGKLYETL